jgi:hypothetical protein
MHVSSFSKCLAPGYRIGWVAAGRYAALIQRQKLSTSLATTVPVQIALADYLKQGGYENHLRHLRRTLAAQEAALVAAVERISPRARASPGPRAATSCGWSCRARWTPWRCTGRPWPRASASRRADLLGQAGVRPLHPPQLRPPGSTRQPARWPPWAAGGGAAGASVPIKIEQAESVPSSPGGLLACPGGMPE